MAISYIGSESTDGTSVAIPAHQAGDFLLFGSFRDGSNSTPTKPGDITQLDTNVTNSAGALFGYKIAASSGETSGTWSNATEVSVMVFRGVDQVNPVGDHKPGTGTSTTLSFTALTMAVGDGTSWAAAIGYHRSTNCDLSVTPSGMTLRLNEQNNADEVGLYDTNGGVASWSVQTTAVGGTSSGWATEVVEIRAATGGAPAPNVSDTATTSESIKMLVESNRSVSDTATLSENVSVAIVTAPLTISVSDTATMTESVGTPAVSYGVAVTPGPAYTIPGVKIV